MSAVSSHLCATLVVAAPASGQGKTSVSAALARLAVRRGLRVRAFKCGPDFLDPMLLARASGSPVHNLDLWMGGAAEVRARVAAAQAQADVVLIEGVMGLHDGDHPTAEVATLLDAPVLAVIDAHAMAQTFGALALGLAHYRSGLRMAGVLGNRVAGAGHAELLARSLPPGLRWWGHLPPDAALSLPERHLGLVPASELADVERRLDAAAAALETALQAAGVEPFAARAPRLPAGVGGVGGFGAMPAGAPLAGRRVAVARDAALNFIYEANLDVLRGLGAELLWFSPLADALPACDAVWLPGGYPELHAPALAARTDLHAALHAHVAAGRPLLAECGGLLLLAQSLDGHPMAGLLPGQAQMQKRLANLGLHEAELPEGRLRGHSFHYARLDSPLPPLTHTRPARAGRRPEPVYRCGRMTATFFHAYFPSNPAAVARLFD